MTKATPFPDTQALLSIDRAKWHVSRGPGKLFKRLAGHLVNDIIDLKLRIIANQSLSRLKSAKKFHAML